MGTDALLWYDVPARSGHSGPGSSSPYINDLEGSMAAVSRNARPHAWFERPQNQTEYQVFPGVGVGILDIRPPIPARIVREEQVTSTAQVSLILRERILWGIGAQLNFSAVASGCDVSEDIVKKVLFEVVEVLVQLRLVDSELLQSTRKHCVSISAFLLWMRAARQTKYRNLSSHLSTKCEAGKQNAMQAMWSDWALCQEGNFVGLTNPRPAARFTSALADAGIKKNQMLVLSACGATPLSPLIQTLNIQSRPCKSRPKRAGHRLFFVQHGLDPVAAKAATLSVVGLHWWMVLLGSLLISRGEI